MDDLWTLEHSQYSEDKGKYPWHIGLLKNTIESNLQDCQHNNRKENKWQIVFIGSAEECHKACEALTQLKIKEGKLSC